MSYRGSGGGGRGGSDRGGESRGGRGGGRGRGRGGSAPPEIRVFRDPTTPYTPPDGTVMNIENTYMQTVADSGGQGDLAVTPQFPPRPGHGTQGKQIAVYANYLRLKAAPQLSLTRYSLAVNPEATGKKLSRVVQLLLENARFPRCVSDQRSVIISPQPLNIRDGEIFEIVYRAEDQDNPPEPATKYQVKLANPTSLDVGTLIRHLSATSATLGLPRRPEIIQALNIVLGHYPQCYDGVVSMGQNRHFSIDRSPQNAFNIHSLGGAMELMRGYFQSVRPATGGLLLNVNVTYSVFLESMPLDKLMSKLGTGDRATLQDKLKRVRVNVTHLPVKKSKVTNQIIPCAKTIFGLAHQLDGRVNENPPHIREFGAGPKGVKFYLATPPSSAAIGSKIGGRYISVFDYFYLRYPQIKLNEYTPVVNVGNREYPNYLPAEVCVVLPGHQIKRRLSPEETQKMMKFACRKPWENGNSIIGDGRAVLGLNPAQDSTLGRFGISIGSSLITVAARLLQPPQIIYKNMHKNVIPINPRSGSWNMANIKFHTGSNLGEWTYVWFKSDRPNRKCDFNAAQLEQTVGRFKDFLIQSGVNASAFIQHPKLIFQVRDGRDSQNDKVISDCFHSLFTTKPTLRFIFCILPYSEVAIYNSIKKYGDTKAGIYTVCVVGEKFMDQGLRQLQYFGNVSLKFNLKAGGINQTLEPSKLGVIGEGKTIVIGIDVTHPSPGSKDSAPSVAGVVASIDSNLGQWPADFRIQEPRKEMVTALEQMIVSRLRLWQQYNKQLPENLIIYRDGVSEGQYESVLDDELPLIRNACRQQYPANITKQGFPKVSIIICGKRHNTRFYPVRESEADRSSNCEPGTVVDRGVTHVRDWDFFIQPHACLQGTARPGHYYVIHDEIFNRRSAVPPLKNSADALESLTYNMCHLFGRATKAVSLCPPAYYADLLCTRLRCYLSDQFEPRVSSAPSGVSRGVGSQNTPAIQVANRLKDSMFYI